MPDHFAAFSFVDRISEFAPGAGATGEFAIPRDIAAFPSCLVAEAVGQLAAWVAMAHIGYRGRPVAALARETNFMRATVPGQKLALAVTIDHCDDEAVAYHGSAHVDGVQVIELNDCLGPMLPVAQFDDPEVLAARFALLRGAGAPPGRFRGVDIPRVVETDAEPGTSARGTLAVPANAPFFNDHFPRRAVFPATLMLDAQIDLALRVARHASAWPPGTPLVPIRMSNVKVRSFTAPGVTLEIAAQAKTASADVLSFALSARADGKAVATAQVDIAPERAA